jgi:glycosyltransferase involved in cell wall biosynthesis
MNGPPQKSVPGLISVIVPTYNRTQYLREALDSIFNQTYKEFEVIVVDDGSLVNVKNAMAAYLDKVLLIRQPHSGLSSALNHGIKSSRGEYIAFLDDDDYWSPLFLEKCYHSFTNNSDTDCVYTDVRYFNGTEKNVLIQRRLRRASGHIIEALIKGNFIPINSAVTRRECFNKAGLFDESLNGFMDWDMWLRIAQAGYKFHYVDEVHAYIRVHDQNMSSQHLKMLRSGLATLRKAYQFNNRSQGNNVSSVARYRSKIIYKAIKLTARFTGRSIRDFFISGLYPS